jgi:hypothetical protein
MKPKTYLLDFFQILTYPDPPWLSSKNPTIASPRPRLVSSLDMATWQRSAYQKASTIASCQRKTLRQSLSLDRLLFAKCSEAKDEESENSPANATLLVPSFFSRTGLRRRRRSEPFPLHEVCKSLLAPTKNGFITKTSLKGEGN